MQLENSFTVPVPIDEAWRVLLDIERIAPCMPGAALDSVDGDDFTGRVKVKLGPINLTYQGKASFIEKDEAAHKAVIDARGKDQRGNGTAAAVVTAKLKAEGSITRVDVLTDLNITGRPAQFGRGVMTDVGNKLLGQFADKLAAQLGEGDAQGDAAARRERRREGGRHRDRGRRGDRRLRRAGRRRRRRPGGGEEGRGRGQEDGRRRHGQGDRQPTDTVDDRRAGEGGAGEGGRRKADRAGGGRARRGRHRAGRHRRRAGGRGQGARGGQGPERPAEGDDRAAEQARLGQPGAQRAVGGARGVPAPARRRAGADRPARGRRRRGDGPLRGARGRYRCAAGAHPADPPPSSQLSPRRVGSLLRDRPRAVRL